jgi:hypothetical protein
MVRSQTLARLLGLAVVAVQGALMVKSPGITHQSPEHAPPIPYLNILPFYTAGQIDSRNSSMESDLQGNIFGKRQREEDENGGLLCKKAPCPDKRLVVTLQSCRRQKGFGKE